MPRGLSQVERASGRGSLSSLSSLSLSAISLVMIWFSSTIVSSVIGLRIVSRARAADDHVLQLDLDGLALVDGRLGDAVERAAVDLVDDDVLRDVGELAGEVAGVGGLQGGVGQALAGAVGGGEVLEHRQAFAEVGLDRRLDDLAGRLGHQTAHAAELTHLVDATAGLGRRHHGDGVEVLRHLALARRPSRAGGRSSSR